MLVKKVPKRAWQKLSAGRGAKGQRFYDRAVIDLVEVALGRHQLLVRRNRTTGELAYYRCHSTARSRPGPPAQLVRWSAGQLVRLATQPPGAFTSRPSPETSVAEHFRRPL
ncbi:hypothetical protein SAV14893_080300 [Streptomyces avermitilis]|uniref:Uncharacterized protein n=1 Tax=Streptomyces avermitilis TaxID=33903 RepID=A0A4D4MHK0_STRAX|nr:hypothetical protein SAV14893_080300 [Streptomyces avermitilis]GDY70989.1 hypothetical protein SAV31267_004740 [Streptomyces avermitilis]